MKYAEVFLPLPFSKGFTYAVPEHYNSEIRQYCRVIVPFGRKLHYMGIVAEIYDERPVGNFEIKEIDCLLDNRPLCRRLQIDFWNWIALYYMCAPGDVFGAAIPTGLINTKGAASPEKLLDKNFKPKTEKYIRLNPDLSKEKIVLIIGRSQKRIGLFSDFLKLQKNRTDISKKYLLEHIQTSVTILNSLVNKGLFLEEEKEIGRIVLPDESDCAFDKSALSVLSETQKIAYDDIRKSFKTKDVTLLHGVTSSGKTEIYIHLIAETLSAGKQALYLLPEIAVTTQITERLQRVFGQRLFVYHSAVSDNERVEIWNHLAVSDMPVVVLGIRSSIFLPFSNLGLIIVDEEHETSFKQQDPAPRYHARNAAMVLARMYGAKTLLGSATPSLESYFWAVKEKYGLVTLGNRFGDVEQPEIEIVNIREQRRKRLMKYDECLSPLLKKKMRETLSNGEQVILFQNRRGFASMVECDDCGYIPKCKHCDVSLTYHKATNRLVCHYCGTWISTPDRCPSCGSGNIKMQGIGTERIEAEIAALFPDARIVRMDADAVHTRNAYKQVISGFEYGDAQVLIGTQMVSKGLDFGKVSLVGIINADGMLSLPDFRANERAFQMLLQVGGRAGRRDKRGLVVIQTSQENNEMLHLTKQLDYRTMAIKQLEERHDYSYPPYSRLIEVFFRGGDEKNLDDVATQYALKLRSFFTEESVSLPVVPPVSKIRNIFVRKIIIKVPLTRTVAEVRKIFSDINAAVARDTVFRKVFIYYDVDPI